MILPAYLHAVTFRFLFLVIACSTSTLLHGQEPGLRRPSVKYQAIDTDTVRVIFPAGLDSIAQRVTHITSYLARIRPIEEGGRIRKIDILIQNATDIPNGYVGLGPWRSEFYLSAPPGNFSLGTLPWHDLLSLHEFRHVQQLSASRKGISKWIYSLQGQRAFSGAVHLSVPEWYIEGDAVATETVMSSQGRGRLPAFTNAFRAMVSDGEFWKYAKVRNGSLNEFIPDEYPLGYLLLNYGRMQFGQQMWDSVLIQSAQYRNLFYPFSAALRDATGMTTDEFYRSAMQHYQRTWNTYPAVDITALVHSPTDASYEDFSDPVFVNDTSLYAIHESFSSIPTIVEVRKDQLIRVIATGLQTESSFSIVKGRICWAELRKHPRWSREDYSAITLYDAETKKKKMISEAGASYFTPALSPDGAEIIAVADDNSGNCALHILDAESGSAGTTLPNPSRVVYAFPDWSPDGKNIVTTARYPDGKVALLSIDLATQTENILVEPTFAPIGRPCITDEWVYFTMTRGQTDQIFRVHRSARYFEQVTDDASAKYDPVIDPLSGDLIYAHYTLRGKKLVRIPADQMDIRQVKRDSPELAPAYLEKGDADVLKTDLRKTFPVSKYALLQKPVRLHSWNFASDDPLYSIELLSENTLNTLQLRSGWEYNRNSESHGPFAEMAFGLWYPQLVAGYSGTRVKTTVQNEPLEYWQHVLSGGIRIPYNTYRGPYFRSGSFSSRFNRINATGQRDFAFNYLSHTLQFTNARRQALQHAESRFSQRLTGRVLHSVDTFTANQLFIAGEINLPSPVKNHFVTISADYQHEQQSNDVRFQDIFSYARGYEEIPGDDLWRIGIDYQLPLFYPDAGFAGIVYLRRIRVAPFYDMMRADHQTFRSTGATLYFDLRVFNVEDATIGIRFARQLDASRENVFSLILPAAL